VNEVILPLLLVKDSCLICISTPLGSSNYYSVWATRRDNRGKLQFNVVNTDEACMRCTQKDRKELCNHRVEDLPAFRPEERIAKVTALMEGNPTLIARELHGKISDSDSAAFGRNAIKRLFAAGAATPEPHARYRVVYVAFDPNGGASGHAGTGSESAIVSMVYEGANISVSVRALYSRPRYALSGSSSGACPGRSTGSPGSMAS
jgi:hypothetical protein